MDYKVNFKDQKDRLSRFYNKGKYITIKVKNKTKEYTKQKAYSFYDLIPKNKKQFYELKDDLIHFVKTYHKRHEKEVPETTGDLNVKLKNKWDEVQNINNYDELALKLTYTKIIDFNGRSYIFDIVVYDDKKDVQIKGDYLTNYNKDKDPVREYHKNTEFNIYIDISNVHLNNGDEINHELETTKNTRLVKNATGIRDLEIKLNELVEKYDDKNIDHVMNKLYKNDRLDPDIIETQN